jgi:hypothetical protein
MNFACDITDKVLQEIIDTIVREVDPERISVSRGLIFRKNRLTGNSHCIRQKK